MLSTDAYLFQQSDSSFAIVSDKASVELISIKSPPKRYILGILTLIKNSFKRYVREELIDLSQDICFVSKRCIAIPDLYNIFPISNAYTDTNNLIIWKIQGDKAGSRHNRR